RPHGGQTQEFTATCLMAIHVLSLAWVRDCCNPKLPHLQLDQAASTSRIGGAARPACLWIHRHQTDSTTVRVLAHAVSEPFELTARVRRKKRVHSQLPRIVPARPDGACAGRRGTSPIRRRSSAACALEVSSVNSAGPAPGSAKRVRSAKTITNARARRS